MKNKLITLILGTAAGFAIAGAASAGTLDDVRQHGFVQCGVSQGLMGFSVPDAQNNWTGMDVDFCRAIAAAVLGDSTKVKFTPLTAKERFTALQSSEVDMVMGNATYTLTRDTALGLDFTGVYYYDGQGFMVKKATGIKRGTWGTAKPHPDSKGTMILELGGKQLPAMKMRITKLLKAFKPLPYGKASIVVGGDEVDDIPEKE